MLSSFQLLVEVRHHALPLIGDPAQAVGWRWSSVWGLLQAYGLGLNWTSCGKKVVYFVINTIHMCGPRVAAFVDIFKHW